MKRWRLSLPAPLAVARPVVRALLWVGAAAIVVTAPVLLWSDGDASPSSTEARTVPRDPARAPSPAQFAPRDVAVPILMYHVLSKPPADAAYPDLWVAPGAFRAQMRWLDDHGYEAVTLGTVLAHWRGRRALPPRPVVITVDDGFRDTATVALPVLAAHGWPGVLNLALHHLDVSWGLGERQIRKLLAGGWEIASHTLTHPDLTGTSDAQLNREIAGSKNALEGRFGIAVEVFCYPAGRYDPRVLAAVRSAGYAAATTTIEGLGRREEPFTLRRIRIDGSDDLAAFARKLGAR